MISAGTENMATATRLDPMASLMGMRSTPVNAGIITMPPPTPSSPASSPAVAPTSASTPARGGWWSRVTGSTMASAWSPSGPAAGSGSGTGTSAERMIDTPLKASSPAVRTIR